MTHSSPENDASAGRKLNRGVAPARGHEGHPVDCQPLRLAQELLGAFEGQATGIRRAARVQEHAVARVVELACSHQGGQRVVGRRGGTAPRGHLGVVDVPDDVVPAGRLLGRLQPHTGRRADGHDHDAEVALTARRDV